MANKIKGSQIVLYRHRVVEDDDVPFACIRNADISFEVDEKLTNSQSSADWEESIVDVTRWSLTGDGLMVLSDQWNYLYLLTSVVDKEQFQIKFVIDNGTPLGLSIVAGNVFIKNLAISSPYGQVATYQFLLKGVGEPSITGTVVTPAGTTIIAGTALEVVNVVATEGQTTFVLAGQIGKNLVYASRGGMTMSPVGSAGAFNSGVTWNPATATATIYSGAVADESFLFLLQ